MNHPGTQHLSEPPSIWALFSKAVSPKRLFFQSTPAGGHATTTPIIPALSVDLTGVKTDHSTLARYRQICGFESMSHLPPTFPHIMAFPLHMALLTDARFPLPLLGLIHLRNSITQYRPLYINEVFDIECTLSQERSAGMGIEFDIITKVSSVGKPVWEEVTTILHRTQKPGANSTKRRTPLPSYQNNQTWRLHPPLGRQYARVSGDFNLIHLYPWSAKLFGFDRAIIHGMWSKTRCIAALTGVLEEQPFKVDVDFKLPVFLPETVQFNWQQADNLIDFQLLNEPSTKPHLVGKITLL